MVKTDFTASDDGSGLASVVPSLPTTEAPVLLDTSTTGPHTFTVTATDYAGNKTVIQRTYTVLNADLTLFPTPGSSLLLGDVDLGKFSTQIVTATNTGNVPIWLTAAVTAGSSTAFSVSGGGVVVSPGGTADLTVRFAPTVAGVFSGALRVTAGDATTHTPYPLALADIVLSGRGVKTELPPDQAAQKVLDDFNKYVSGVIPGMSLVGSGSGTSGSGRLGAMRNMIEAAGDYIARGDYVTARTQLIDIIARCDGLPKPPDFVSGTARQQLCDEATALLKSIGG